MKAPSIRAVRCAVYTRVSTEYGLDQDFNSLDAQYDAASAYIKSQAHAGWTLIRSRYDDGGYSGGSTDRPDLQRLLDDIRARKLDVIVVYKVDRLTRSLADFAKLVELFDAHSVLFVSVTQLCVPKTLSELIGSRSPFNSDFPASGQADIRYLAGARSRITRTDSISDHFQELKLLRLPINVREGTCPMCSGLTINLQLSID